MQLTTANAAPYLVARRLMHPDVIVDGDLMAIDSSRRNRNVKLRRRNGTGLFLKQVQSAEPADLAAVQREAACYRLPLEHPALAPLARIMPRYRHYDAATRILTMDLIPDGESLYLHMRTAHVMEPAIARALGEALATLHAADLAGALDAETLARTFPATTPWILSAHEFTPANTSAAVSGANHQLFDLVRRHPGFKEALQSARDEWQHDRLIHGDMKWDNCLVHLPDGNQPVITFADWELADRGDPAWDVGALFQAWLAHWIGSIPEGTNAPPSQLAAMATIPLDAMHPAIRAFWDAYRTARALTGSEHDAFLLRATRAAGARMIQTAYESLAMVPQLSANMVLLLQVSLNVLTRAQDAQRQLLALA